MIIRRPKRVRGFVQVENSVARNASLSFEARGMLLHLLSLPDDWEIHINQLATCSPAGITKTRRIVKELMAAGHLRREQPRGDKGQFESAVWEILEIPVTEDKS